MKMLSFVRIATAAVLLLSVVGAIPVASAAQTGGLPSLADQVTLLQVQVQTQMTAITTLQTTVVNLQTSNNALQAALDAEKAARIAGDNSLQTALSTETTNRVNGDASLNFNLQLVSSKENFDASNLQTRANTLQSEIDGLNASTVGNVYVGTGPAVDPLNNNVRTVVASVNVPAGTYLIHAVVPAWNGDGDSQSGGCVLSTAPSTPGSFPNGGYAEFLEFPSISDGGEVQIPLIDARSFASATTITVGCSGFNWGVEHATIKALSVRSIQ